MSEYPVCTVDRRNERLQTLMQAIDELPSIPETLVNILKIMDDPDSSAGDLAEVMRYDAPLTSKILRLANSPFYSRVGNHADIKSCIAVLGFKTVRQVAICVSIATSLLAACNEKRCRLDYRELWRHSVITGAISTELAKISGDSEPEEVFTAGLLHDLGKFVILMHAPLDYDAAMESRRLSGRKLLEVEQECFGFDHTLAGEALGRSWRFPDLLTDPARCHHDVIEAGDDIPRRSRVSAWVALADHLANESHPPHSDLGYDIAHVDAEALHRSARVTPDQLDAARESIDQAIRNSETFLDLA